MIPLRMNDNFLSICFLACLGFCSNGTANETPLKYRIGATVFSESEQQLVVHASAPLTISVLAGGATWPRVSLDAVGLIYVGNVVIDGATGSVVQHPNETLVLPHDVAIKAAENGFRFRHAGNTCVFSREQIGSSTQRTTLQSLKNSNIAFSSASTGLLALVTQFGEDGKVANYRVEQLDLNRCKILFHQDLGNPDLLVELGHSTEGGWWLTGSIEQTLLQSSDGRQWRKATLPAGLSSLISAYVVNPHEIWLAAILPAGEIKSPYLLVYSGDGGRSWRNVVADDPILRRIPSGWLEGQRRRAQ
jgi:hypothetical protein